MWVGISAVSFYGTSAIIININNTISIIGSIIIIIGMVIIISIIGIIFT